MREDSAPFIGNPLSHREDSKGMHFYSPRVYMMNILGVVCTAFPTALHSLERVNAQI